MQVTAVSYDWNYDWNAENYIKYCAERTRPAHDLLAAIPTAFQPKTVYDLGCGPGNSTILLKNRWPHAQVIGIDSSLEMLNQAKKAYPDISFIFGDIQNFSLSKKIDCLFANASLQWLNNHEILFPQLLKCINPNGVFAVQIPNNFHAPSHQVAISILQNKSQWQSILKNLRYGILTQPLYQLSWYYDLLTKLGMTGLQLWETEYLHEMPNYSAIFDWITGTGLRVILSAMDQENQKQFAHEYIEAIAAFYPVQVNQKILLPFKRAFMVGYNG